MLRCGAARLWQLQACCHQQHLLQQLAGAALGGSSAFADSGGGWQQRVRWRSSSSCSSGAAVLSSDDVFAPLGGGGSGDGGVGDAAGAAVASPVSAADAAQLLQQADELVAVSSVASDAAVAAVMGSSWAGTRMFVDALLLAHDACGLPWVWAIGATNLVVRACTLPVTIMTQKSAPLMQAMRKDAEKLKAMSQQMHSASNASEYALRLEQVNAAHADFRARYKGQGKKSLLMPAFGVLQAVVFISQFNAVTSLAREKLPSMTHEGALWFSDLTLPDPLYGLPLLCSAATLAMLYGTVSPELAGETGVMMRRVMMAVAVIMVPAGGYVSAAVALLWASNALLSAGQNLLLAAPAVRARLGLAPLPPPSAAAQQSVLAGLVGKLSGTGAGAPKPKPPPPPPPGRPPGMAVSYLANKPRRPPRAVGGTGVGAAKAPK